jgi:hypothetical protein
MKNITFLLFLIFSSYSFSEEVSVDSVEDPYKFKPMLLDGDDDSGAVLGIEYGYQEKWTFLKSESGEGSGFEGGQAAVSQLTDKNGFVEFNINGIWTNDDEVNPESYSKANLDLGYEILRPDNIGMEANDEFDIDFGLQLAFEGDQNYESSQTSVAAQAGTMFGSSTDRHIAAIIGYGEVDASNNDERKSITDQNKFDRITAEIHIKYPLSFNSGRKYSPKSISFNYRYFGEIDASEEVKDAGIDKYEFGVLRLKFENGIFIGYGKGKLPFDFDAKSVLKVGITQNLF